MTGCHKTSAKLYTLILQKKAENSTRIHMKQRDFQTSNIYNFYTNWAKSFYQNNQSEMCYLKISNEISANMYLALVLWCHKCSYHVRKRPLDYIPPANRDHTSGHKGYCNIQDLLYLVHPIWYGWLSKQLSWNLKLAALWNLTWVMRLFNQFKETGEVINPLLYM